VIVVWDGRGVTNDGRPYENSYASVMRMRDGEVIDGTAFYDSLRLSHTSRPLFATTTTVATRCLGTARSRPVTRNKAPRSTTPLEKPTTTMRSRELVRQPRLLAKGGFSVEALSLCEKELLKTLPNVRPCGGTSLGYRSPWSSLA
jgi:hypothetical protein